MTKALDSKRPRSEVTISQSHAHSRRSSLVYPLFAAFPIPVIIGLFKPSLIRSFWDIMFFVVLGMSAILILRLANDWIVKDKSLLQALWDNTRPVPPGLAYGTDLKKYAFPWVTVTLVIVNSFLFFTLPERMVKAAVFLPYGDPSLVQIISSFFTSAFLHGNFQHLAGNMIFLWTFGSAVEPRIGSERFSVVYFLCIVTSELFVLILLIIQNIYQTVNDHPNGATHDRLNGAI
jgi:hypothetical protein